MGMWKNIYVHVEKLHSIALGYIKNTRSCIIDKGSIRSADVNLSLGGLVLASVRGFARG